MGLYPLSRGEIVNINVGDLFVNHKESCTLLISERTEVSSGVLYRIYFDDPTQSYDFLYSHDSIEVLLVPQNGWQYYPVVK